MELWEQLGHKSFGDWRRASEKARREAAKKKATTAVTAGAHKQPAYVPPAYMPPPPALWQPLETIQPPSAPSSPGADFGGGELHEHLQVTPHGSRVHTMRHKSPGGTMREKQDVSPAGEPKLGRVDRVDIWQQQVGRERRAARWACEREQEPEATDACDRPMTVWRFLRHRRCGSCVTCLELDKFGGSKHRASAPCETVLSRLDYTESERTVVCDATQRFARGWNEEKPANWRAP